MTTNKLEITNARENNLKEISLQIPHDTFTVVTGLSGSGKSSLAFNTVFAEGQRRYIETFSPYTRQFFDKVKKPDLDFIDNVRPAVAIKQRTRITNSRSTVGTMTNLTSYLNVLWTNIAKPVCPKCGKELTVWNADKLVLHLGELQSKNTSSSFLICSKVLVSKKKKILDGEIDRLITLGFSRYFDTKKMDVVSLEDSPPKPSSEGELMVVLDRVRPGSFNFNRAKDSIGQAYSLSNVSCTIIENSQSKKSKILDFPSSPSCCIGVIAVEKPRQSLFSFNHPFGACPECNGFGQILSIDPELCVPNPSLSIEKKALQCWSGPSTRNQFNRLKKFCLKSDISTTTPWQNLSEEEQDLIFSNSTRDYKGVFPWFKRRERKAYKMHVRVFLARYRGQFRCPVCKGQRLRPEALVYQVDGTTLPVLWQKPIGDMLSWLSILLTKKEKKNKFPRQIRDLFGLLKTRLEFLSDLGLSYLDLDRQARTLSGGETQRVNLAAALGSDLISTHFVLDEPSVGLHSRDTKQLLKSLHNLQRKGNSLLVVEHDPECIHSADQIIELGPGTGSDGGNVVYSGSHKSWKSIHPPPEIEIEPKKPSSLTLKIKKASSRNLKGFNLNLPLERFVCLTGVSGSGKSTLATEVIKKAFDHLQVGIPNTSGRNTVNGFKKLEQVLLVNQAPLARSPRANIATYSKIWDRVRTTLSQTDEASLRALSKSSFSFNVEGGRCPACKGAGFIKEDMQFLSDVYLPCEVCLGKRFQQPVLEVFFKGKNVNDLLQMSIKECTEFFESDSFISRAVENLSMLGLGHLTLGHPLSELSGGEAQRLKLIPFIQKSQKGKSLLIFDEPTTGLHETDIERLITLFKTLRSNGHSVLAIEHNLRFILSSDWIIDLGPEGGEEGGYLVKEGLPTDFIQAKKSDKSYTAKYLTNLVKSENGKKKKGPSISTKATQAAEKILDLSVRGAKEHNLKNIDVSLPLNQIVALTGVSGSGKSTIAKDIIYAEGQRRYLDCLSPYARHFIKELKKPEIDSISGIRPTICVYQHTFQPSKLSTVATMSEVYNFLRLLFSKTGKQYCPDHPDQSISPLAPDLIAAEISNLKARTVRILAPIIKLKKGKHKSVIARAVDSEISELRVDGVFLTPGKVSDGLEKGKPHSIEYTVGRFNPKNLTPDLIEEAVQQALALGGGNLIVHFSGKDIIYSIQRTCPVCKKGFFKPDPEDLSFNSKRGVCPSCKGTGRTSSDKQCSSCKGGRITKLGRHLLLSELNIHDCCLLTAPSLKDFLDKISFDSTQVKIAGPILNELFSKLDTLISLGLDHIELDRDCHSLSSGELQRLRLAAAMGSPLSGAMYVLDEPSAGLHPLDNRKVLNRLKDLKERDNSVIIIEHDAESILSADYVLDVGPGGGKDGGEVVFSGPLSEFLEDQISVTSRSILQTFLATKENRAKSKEKLSIKNGSKNNIKSLDLEIPMNSLVTIAGVSGAGKSSLVNGIVTDTIMHSHKQGKPGQSWKKSGIEILASSPVDRVLIVDQVPIGANSRSTPASYLGIWSEIRKIYATTIDARTNGWTPSFFSYNTGKGRCDECGGRGEVKLEMSFLPDARILCDACSGRRFGSEADSVIYLGLRVSDVLALTFEEARSVFANHKKLHRILHQACELGLGYLTLGQSSTTLSGGESQRIKLVTELNARRKGHTLYVLNEPTTGLHKADVAKLVKTLKQIVALENTVLVIEHDSDIIMQADHIIEMGPGPGEKGGKVIFQGPPAKLCKAATPWGNILRD